MLRLGEVRGTPEPRELVAKPRNNEGADGRSSAARWPLPLPHLANSGQLAVYLEIIFKLRAWGPCSFKCGLCASCMGITRERVRKKTLRPFPRPPESESVFEASYSQPVIPVYRVGGSGRGILAQVKTGTPDLARSIDDHIKAKSVKGNIFLIKTILRINAVTPQQRRQEIHMETQQECSVCCSDPPSTCLHLALCPGRLT